MHIQTTYASIEKSRIGLDLLRLFFYEYVNKLNFGTFVSKFHNIIEKLFPEHIQTFISYVTLSCDWPVFKV